MLPDSFTVSADHFARNKPFPKTGLKSSDPGERGIADGKLIGRKEREEKGCDRSVRGRGMWTVEEE